ncbi:hypothetical protein MT418_005658 [Batrachochytrium dendrobatidis]
MRRVIFPWRQSLKSLFCLQSGEFYFSFLHLQCFMQTLHPPHKTYGADQSSRQVRMSRNDADSDTASDANLSSRSSQYSEYSNDTHVRTEVKKLDRELRRMAESSTGQTDSALKALMNQTTDVWFRQHVQSHQPPSRTIQKKIAMHCQTPFQSTQHHYSATYLNSMNPTPTSNANQHRITCTDSILHDPAFSLVGLHPDISITDQLNLLRAQEKFFLIEQWRTAWDQARPPVPRWYMLKNKQFSTEAKRARVLLTCADQQESEYQTRMNILYLHREMCKDLDYQVSAIDQSTMIESFKTTQYT